VVASFILAVAPVHWLITTWFDPSYQSTGIVYLVVIVVLIVWSASSPVTNQITANRKNAVTLLLVSALLRLTSQVMAINILGGIALALDVFAILVLFNMPNRKRPLSPFWVSVLFLFTLPFERVLQRLLGYPMQEISAAGTCNLLGVFFDDLICNGVRLQVAAQDVLVDLPCSGTASLMLSGAFAVLLNAIYRPSLRHALLWGAITLVLAILGNILRITLLAVGLVQQDYLFGLDVMAQPLHDLIGYATIVVSLLPLLIFYKPKPARPHQWPAVFRFNYSKGITRAAALGFVVLALVVVSLPRQALDVSVSIAQLYMPSNLNGQMGQNQPLEPVERQYFKKFGGRAQKALFGPLALTLVQTTSPLRHLHAPEDCLRGLGYKIEFLGTRFEPVPTALYRATGSGGDKWHVAITFTASSGYATSNVAEAIWHWLKFPKTEWTSIQRITPWALLDNERQAYEAAVIAALDITQIKHIKEGDV
jgi:exosortase